MRVGANYTGWRGAVAYVKKISLHPRFNNVTYENDIAILTLKNPLNFSKAVQSVQLPDNVSNNGKFLNYTGFGVTQDAGVISKRLQKFQFRVVDSKQCKQEYQIYVTDDKICGINRHHRPKCWVGLDYNNDSSY